MSLELSHKNKNKNKNKNKIKIANIFSIGFRCNACEFLEFYLQIRKYSSPFSYMVIDIKTALSFIDNKFENYTHKDFIDIGNRTNTFNKLKWSFNNRHKITGDFNAYDDILNMKKVCIWNHHKLYDKNTIESINRRSHHLLTVLENKPETMLLFYIEKIQEYKENASYFDISILDKYACKFLIIIPLLNFNSNPVLYYDSEKIKIIYFNSNLEGWGTDRYCHVDEWNKLKVFVNQLYEFNIEHREDNIMNIEK